jgi:hypothetical protein
MTSSCSIDADAMTFASYGAQRFAAALDKAGLESIEAAIAGLPAGKAGLRFQGLPAPSAILAASGTVGRIAASVLGETCRPVRAVLFDKTSATSWSLAWHQDRTIAVAERREVEGFGPWTIKNGMRTIAVSSLVQRHHNRNSVIGPIGSWLRHLQDVTTLISSHL